MTRYESEGSIAAIRYDGRRISVSIAQPSEIPGRGGCGDVWSGGCCPCTDGYWRLQAPRGACAIYCWRPASMIFWQS